MTPQLQYGFKEEHTSMLPEPALDQGRDLSGRELYRLVSVFEAPEWVKSAAAAEICGDQIPGHLYADPRGHLYPTHTRAATWVSTAFFLDKKAHYPRRFAELVQERLEKSADFFGIGAEFDRLVKQADALAHDDLARLADDDFAYVGVDDAGGKERRLPLRNAVEVKAEAAWLERYRDRLAYPDRRAVATRVLRKAARYGAALGEHDEFLEKTAGFGGCSAGQAVAAVRQRAVLARHGHPDVAAQLEKLAVQLESDPPGTRSPDRLQKLAHTLELADRLLKVEYGGAVRRPEDVLFAVTRKAAADLAEAHVPTSAGSVYALDDLGKLKVKALREHFGDELAGQATDDGLWASPQKLAELLPSLTRRDAELFDRMARAAGVAPRYKEAAARRVGLTPEVLRTLAAAHRPA